MKAAIRVDASIQMGTGHFMRCMTLADALKKFGAQTRFISRNLPEHLQNMLLTKGHEFRQLNIRPNGSELDDLAHAEWLGTSQLVDAQDSIKALSDHDWDWLVVDHYALDARWESSLRQTANNILVIDDIADRHHNADVLLDQNYYAGMEARYNEKVPAHCRLLLGPRYAMLRYEFSKLHDQIKPRSGTVERILVFFGGVDVDNYTGRTIEILSEVGIPGLAVEVVIGAQHPFLEQISNACAQYGFICHVQTDKMAELMSKADLAIGAGGSASWERCCMGLPTLLVAVADNQVDLVKALDFIGVGIYVGASKMGSMSNMRTVMARLLSSEQDELNTLSKKAYSIVDGRGVDRVCQEMGC